MPTFEVQNTTIEQRTILRNIGFSVEKLDHIYSNVSTSDERANDLEDFLIELELEYRLV